MLPDPSKKRLGIKVTPFSNFFVWCQVCRHGGHAEHIEGNLYEKKIREINRLNFQRNLTKCNKSRFSKKSSKHQEIWEEMEKNANLTFLK